MTKAILIYGLPAGETERYTEALLSEGCKTSQDIERIKTAASRDGFHSFRIAYWDGTAPDFTNVLSKSR